MSTNTQTPDTLWQGGYTNTEKKTLLLGESVVRGTVVGLVTKGAAAVTYGGSNTGNGTISTATLGLDAKVGAYALRCASISSGVVTKTVPTTGTKAGTNTGDGTMTGVADGGSVLEGVYTMTCVNADTNGSEVFDVVDPNGNMLQQATVDVAYESDQIDFTINDGGGANYFVVGDSFTVTVAFSTADHDSGVFTVHDPDGYRLEDATVDVAYSNDHLAFTIADGSTDFVVGDTITITIAAGSGKAKELDKTATDGSAKPYGIAVQAADAADADVENVEFYITGKFDRNELNFASGTTYSDVEDDFRKLGVILVNPTEMG